MRGFPANRKKKNKSEKII